MALLTNLVEPSETLQVECATVVPTLLSVLAVPSISPSLRCCFIRCLAALCSRCTINRRAVLKSTVLGKTIGPLMNALQALVSAQPTHQRSSHPLHPTVLSLQLAVVELYTHLSEGPTGMIFLPAEVDSTAATLLQLLSFLDSPHLTLRVASVRCLSNLLRPQSAVREMLVRAHAIPKLVRLSSETGVWKAASLPPLPDELEADHPPSLALQLRLHSLHALCNFTDMAPLANKSAVLAELSLDSLLALLTPCEEDWDGASDCSHAPTLLATPAWTLLRHLLQPSGHLSSEEEVAADSAFLSAHDVARVLDLIITRAHASPAAACPSHAHLLATIAARYDCSSKLLLCHRPAILSLLHSTLQQSGEGVKWASLCIANLLQPTAEEHKEASMLATAPPSSPRTLGATAAPANSLVARMQLLLEHSDLLPQMLRMVGRGDDISTRIQQCLLHMHSALKQSSSQPSLLQSAHGASLVEFAAACESSSSSSSVTAAPSSPLPASIECAQLPPSPISGVHRAHTDESEEVESDNEGAIASSSRDVRVESSPSLGLQLLLSSSPGIEEIESDSDASSLSSVDFSRADFWEWLSGHNPLRRGER